MEPNSVFPINFTPFIATPFTAVDRTGTNKNPCSRPTKKKKKRYQKKYPVAYHDFNSVVSGWIDDCIKQYFLWIVCQQNHHITTTIP
jgi:hypothetical protein